MLSDLLYRLRKVFRRDRMAADLVPEQKGNRRLRLARDGLAQFTAEGSARGLSALTLTWQDIRYAFRVLCKSPVFSSVAIISLAIGIGANTVVFSVVNALILRLLPFPNADRLLSVQPSGGTTTSFPNYRDLRDRNEAFSSLAAYRITAIGLNTGANSQRVWGYLATGNYFETLGAIPLMGRFFSPAEDRERGADPYAVLSYECWKNRLGGDPAIVGRTIRLNGLAYTVLGVAPKGFQGTELFYWPDIWVPMSMQAQIESFFWLDDRTTANTMIVGRLKDGITAQTAEAQLEPIAAALSKEHPNWNEGLRFKLAPPGLMGGAGRGPIAVFTGGVLVLAGLVLLGACANLASLLAARTADRHKELAIRMSLGAGRGRIARQLMTESVLLACSGGFAAWGLSVLLLGLLSNWRAPLDFPVQLKVDPDWRVFLFTWLVAIFTGVLLGIAPTQRAWRTDPNQVLKGMPMGSARKWPLRDLLLPVQMALCYVLVMSSLLSVRGLQRALMLPLGFEPSGVAVAGFDLGLSGHKKAQGQAIQRAALEAAARIPGVSSAAFANSVPLSIDQSTTSVVPERATDLRSSARINASVYEVSPGYFRTIGTRILSGREFSWQDQEKTPRVAIINETLARRLYGRTDVTGRHFRSGARAVLTEIVGVVQDGKYMKLTEAPRPALFRAMTQVYNSETILIARTPAAEPQTAAEMRRAIAGIDATIAAHSVGSLNQMLGFAYFPARAATIALSIFGILAILLAATGIYGMAVYAISRRHKEIGIRMAMGAQPGHILRVVLGRAALLLLAGSTAGFLMGVAAGPLLAGVVYQASSSDPLVMAAVPLAIGLTAFAALLRPARRALNVEPLYALRQE